ELPASVHDTTEASEKCEYSDDSDDESSEIDLRELAPPSSPATQTPIAPAPALFNLSLQQSPWSMTQSTFKIGPRSSLSESSHSSDHSTQTTSTQPQRTIVESRMWECVREFDNTLWKVRAGVVGCKKDSNIERAIEHIRNGLYRASKSIETLASTYDGYEMALHAVVANDIHTQVEKAEQLLSSFYDDTQNLEDVQLDERSTMTQNELLKKMSDIERSCSNVDKQLQLLGCKNSSQLFRALKSSYDWSKDEHRTAINLTKQLASLTHTTHEKPPRHETIRLCMQLREEESKQKLSDIFSEGRIIPREIQPATSFELPPVKVVQKPAPSKLLPSFSTTIQGQPNHAGSLSFQKPRPATPTNEKSKPIKVATLPFAPSPKAKAPPVRKLLNLGSLVLEETSDAMESPRVRKMSNASNGGSHKMTDGVPHPTPKSATLKTEFAVDVKSPLVSGIPRHPPENPIERFTLGTNYMERMANFYEMYAPGKDMPTSTMERHLEQNKGSEDELFLRLIQKYVHPTAVLNIAKEYIATGIIPASLLNPPPPPPPASNRSAFITQSPMVNDEYRSLLIAFYTQYNPSKLSDVDNVLLKYRGKEEKLFKNLETKYHVTFDPNAHSSQATMAYSTSSEPNYRQNMGFGFGQSV
ncbi:hypothetical protein THRCLA_00071, partial [Thraustotheca clavata]